MGVAVQAVIPALWRPRVEDSKMENSLGYYCFPGQFGLYGGDTKTNKNPKKFGFLFGFLRREKIRQDERSPSRLALPDSLCSHSTAGDGRWS